MKTDDLLKRATPRPWRVLKDVRCGPSGKKHADQWVIDSKTRKLMALLEVWALSEHASEGAKREHLETLAEVAANSELITRAVNSFEAMRESLRLIRNQSIGPDWTHEQAFNFMLEQAKAALKLAEGEQPISPPRVR